MCSLLFPLDELENSRVVPGKFMTFTKSAAIQQTLKEEITHIKELCKHMDREITEGRETYYSPLLILL